jgi:F-type H+-transporting ATPase subunit a
VSVTVPVLGLEVPPIDHLINWPSFLFDDTPFAVNKVVLIYLFAMIVTMLFFFLAARRAALVPSGMQNLAEASLDFIRESVILQTIGPDGMRFLPLLTTMFFFIFFSNITEVIPFVQFPANARMAVPMLLALLVWFIYNVVGVAKQGPLHYLKNSLIPPGVPWPLLFLVVPIEFVSTFLVRPFSLAVRLFANMLAGHLILVTFAVICAALWSLTPLVVILPFAFGLLVGLTGFEVLVAALQAFIFTILAAVYIGGSMHPEH